MNYIFLFLLILSWGCQPKDPQKTGPSFKSYLEDGDDSDQDGHTDAQETFMGQNPLQADFPNLKINSHDTINIQFDLYDSRNQLQQIHSQLNDPGELSPYIYSKAIQAIYNHFYRKDKFEQKITLSDIFSYRLGCLPRKDVQHMRTLSDFLVEKITLKSQLQIDVFRSQYLQRLNFLQGDFQFYGQLDTRPLSLAPLIHHYNLLPSAIELPRKFEIMTPPLELQDMQGDKNCFELNLSRLEYTHHKKRIQLNELLQKLDKNNATIIYINGKQKWVKSVAAQGSVLDLFKSVHLGSVLDSNPIHINEMTAEEQMNQLQDSSWYFLSIQGHKLKDQASASTYILANLSRDTFQKESTPLLQKTHEYENIQNLEIPNLKPKDRIIIQSRFYQSWSIPEATQSYTHGMKWDECHSYGGSRNHDRCRGGWKKDKNSCLVTTQYSHMEKIKWHPVIPHGVASTNLTLHLGLAQTPIKPTFILGNEVVYIIDVMPSYLQRGLLKLKWHPTIVSEQFAVTKQVNYRDRSRKRKCHKEKTQNSKINVEAKQKLDLVLTLQRW